MGFLSNGYYQLVEAFVEKIKLWLLSSRPRKESNVAKLRTEQVPLSMRLRTSALCSLPDGRRKADCETITKQQQKPAEVPLVSTPILPTKLSLKNESKYKILVAKRFLLTLSKQFAKGLTRKIIRSC